MLNTIEVQQGWREIAPLIDVALQYSHMPADNLDAVKAELYSGDAVLLEIIDGLRMVGCCVAQRLATSGGDYLNVWTLGGTGMEDWLPQLLDFLDAMARQSQLRGVMCGGRPGWRRALRKFGWQEEAVIMRKELEPCH